MPGFSCLIKVTTRNNLIREQKSFIPVGVVEQKNTKIATCATPAIIPPQLGTVNG